MQLSATHRISAVSWTQESLCSLKLKYTFSRLPSRVLVVPITFCLRVRLEEKRVDTTDIVQS